MFVAIINVGPMYYSDITLQAIGRYYDYFGIRWGVIGKHHPETKETSPSWIRCLSFELFPEEDFILTQGVDVVPCNFKYDIRDFIDERFVNLAVDQTVIGCDPEKHSFPHFKYNADLIGYPKSMAPFFREVWDRYKNDPAYKETFEQYCMNKELHDQRVYVNELPNLFNRFFHPTMDYQRTAFCHYTNFMPSREKLKWIEGYHPMEMIR